MGQSSNGNGSSSSSSHGGNGGVGAQPARTNAKIEASRGGSDTISERALFELCAADFEAAATVANRAAAVLPGGAAGKP